VTKGKVSWIAAVVFYRPDALPITQTNSIKAVQETNNISELNN